MAAADDGIVLVVRDDCPTCRLVEPVVRELVARGVLADVICQDYPAFLAGVPVTEDRSLEHSFRLGIDIVPTLVRRRGGDELARAVGWHRDEWRALTGVPELGAALPQSRPGCGSLSIVPGMAEELVERYGHTGLRSREIAVEFPADPVEHAFDLGWSDGLPVVPPTPARVLRMLSGTRRGRDEVVAEVPPSGAPCTVEKAAVNAVMAGCRPQYLPLLLAAIEAAADPAYAWQGLLATTMGAGNVLVVNGPAARTAGMNAGVNALGHGNRANATLGRALQLVGRNVGGAVPGATDRSTQGHPGKLGMAFAEHEDDPDWPSLARARGVADGRSAVTVYAGVGSALFFDERSRTPQALTASFVAQLEHLRGGRERRGMLLVVSPEHRAVLRAGGWSREAFADALLRETGMHADDLLLTLAGGGAGLMSTVIPGWAAGPRGSQAVTREVRP